MVCTLQAFNTFLVIVHHTFCSLALSCVMSDAAALLNCISVVSLHFPACAAILAAQECLKSPLNREDLRKF